MSTNDDAAFGEYLARFARLVGQIETGQYGHFRGRLIPKLGLGDFHFKAEEYRRVGDAFTVTIERGDTVDDAVPLQLRALEAELVIERSPYFPNDGQATK